MEPTISNNIEPLLSSRASYARSLSHVKDELRSFQSCPWWMCVNQSDERHTMIFWSVFLLLDIFIPTASDFVLSYAPTDSTYNMVV
ncbi:hypothetical protein GW17_00029410 [Ensete ventricosum]|nr:hypothetical protein GW17_00029410 [Ensete ventricosum]